MGSEPGVHPRGHTCSVASPVSSLDKTSTPMLAIQFKSIDDHWFGEVGRLQVVNHDSFYFKGLVVEKEPLDQRQSVRWQFTRFLELIELRVVEGHGQNLVVLFAAVDHRH